MSWRTQVPSDAISRAGDRGCPCAVEARTARPRHSGQTRQGTVGACGQEDQAIGHGLFHVVFMALIRQGATAFLPGSQGAQSDGWMPPVCGL